MEQETTQKRRGRPRKVAAEDNPVAEVAPETQPVSQPTLAPQATDTSAATAAVLSLAIEELKAMQEQNRYQTAMFMKVIEKMGLSDPPRPPKEDTVVLQPADPQDEYVVDQFGQDLVVPQAKQEDSGKPSPGSLTGRPGDRNVGWIPWRKEDLNPDDSIDFVPAPVPTLVFPMTDEEGRQKIRLDVNDLVCWLTVGVPNRVNKFFKNAYDNGFDTWRELENFKRKGPSVAPWGQVGPDGRPSWYYDPMTISFGMDDDGHAITPFRSNPLRSYQQNAPDAI